MTLRNENLPIYGAINVKELKNYITDACDNEKTKNTTFCNRIFAEDLKPSGGNLNTQPNSKRGSLVLDSEPNRKMTIKSERRAMR